MKKIPSKEAAPCFIEAARRTLIEACLTRGVTKPRHIRQAIKEILSGVRKPLIHGIASEIGQRPEPCKIKAKKS